jgi:hypothetical protein
MMISRTCARDFILLTLVTAELMCVNPGGLLRRVK